MKIAFLGDSLTASNDWQSVFVNNECRNFGVNGDKTDQILARINEVIAYQPSKVFILMGINDLGEGRSIDSILMNYMDVLNALQVKIEGVEIVILSVLPVNTDIFKNSLLRESDIKLLNKRLKIMANEYHSYFLDLYSFFASAEDKLDSGLTYDGLHLNEQAYELWNEQLKLILRN